MHLSGEANANQGESSYPINLPKPESWRKRLVDAKDSRGVPPPFAGTG